MASYPSAYTDVTHTLDYDDNAMLKSPGQNGGALYETIVNPDV